MDAVSSSSLENNTNNIIVNIDNTELKNLLERNVVLIDVRIPFEWEDTGIIKGSIPILFFNEKGQPQAEQWIARASNHIKPDKEVALLCHSGRRSRIVAEYLALNHGYHKLYNHAGGMNAWLEGGNETLTWIDNAA